MGRIGCFGYAALCLLGYVGGNSGNDLNAGPSYFNGNNGLSNSNTNIGARLTMNHRIMGF